MQADIRREFHKYDTDKNGFITKSKYPINICQFVNCMGKLFNVYCYPDEMMQAVSILSQDKVTISINL